MSDEELADTMTDNPSLLGRGARQVESVGAVAAPSASLTASLSEAGTAAPPVDLLRIVDPGHVYDVPHLDDDGYQRIVFVKREGSGYPGNVGHFPGVNCQGVIRVLIDRVKYLNGQIACEENAQIIEHLRECIRLFEIRAAKRHGLPPPHFLDEVENMPVSAKDGHIRTAAPPADDEMAESEVIWPGDAGLIGHESEVRPPFRPDAVARARAQAIADETPIDELVQTVTGGDARDALVNAIASAITEAERAERERCAKIAASHSPVYLEAALNIANAIRSKLDERRKDEG